MKCQGRSQDRRLEFLRILLNKLGITRKTFALAVGWVPQTLEYHFMEDDIRYGSLKKGFAAFGYCLEAHFECQGNANDTVSLSSCRIEGLESVRPLGQVQPDYPSYLEDCVVRASPVAFVAEAIMASARSAGFICKEANIDSTCLRVFLKKDDIKISFLFKLAKPLHSTLVWRIYPLDEND